MSTSSSTGESKLAYIPFIVVGVAAGTVVSFKDEIFGTDLYTGEQVRFLKRIGFMKRGDGYVMTQECADRYYNDVCRAHEKRLKTNQTYDTCLEAVRTYPFFIEDVKPEYLDTRVLEATMQAKYFTEEYNSLSGYTYDIFASITEKELVKIIQDRSDLSQERKAEILDWISANKQMFDYKRYNPASYALANRRVFESDQP
jgi:hypothetical protein